MAKKTITRPVAGKPARKRMVSETAVAADSNTEERGWQQMFVVTEHWQSDLKFFADELNFFRKLIDKYFMWLTEEKNIGATRKLVDDLTKYEKRRSDIEQKTAGHIRHLASLMEDPFAQNGQRSKDEHVEIEALIAQITKDFRSIKNEVFQLTETILESEKVKHLLAGR